MLVTDLEQMTRIVNSRNDLEWEGWNVVKYTRNSNAYTMSDGVFKNGVWMIKKVFPVTEDGWYIPNSIGLADAQVER